MNKIISESIIYILVYHNNKSCCFVAISCLYFDLIMFNYLFNSDFYFFLTFASKPF